MSEPPPIPNRGSGQLSFNNSMMSSYEEFPQPEAEFESPYDLPYEDVVHVQQPKEHYAACVEMARRPKQKSDEPKPKPRAPAPQPMASQPVNPQPLPPKRPASQQQQPNTDDGSYLKMGSVNIPSTVRKMASVGDELLKHHWYYPSIQRSDAEMMLTREPIGTFVVRPRSQGNTFVLSIRVTGTFSHLEITKEGGKYILGENSEPHTSIPNLINYHRRVPIDILGKEMVGLIDYHP